MTVVVVACVALAAYGLTALVFIYVSGSGRMDVPNHRSLHDEPTPRGGGLAIGVVLTAAIAVLYSLGILYRPLAFALMGGIPLLTLIGWLDDTRSRPVHVRLGVHLLAACWASYCLSGLTGFSIGQQYVDMGAVGFLLCIIGIVWAINLYNFMDGIDGLAASQGVMGAAIVAVLAFMRAGDVSVYIVSVAVAAASGGFLLWNWPPARIFMGDAGSGTFGFTFAVLAITSEKLRAVSLLSWAIIFTPFIFDATMTVMRRALRGEQITNPHQLHAYQRVVRAGYSHRSVTLTFLVLSIPMALLAYAAETWPQLALATFLLATMLVAGLYLAVERLSPMNKRVRS